MMNKQEKLLKIMLWIVLVGGSYLSYINKVDGVLINKVIVFTNGVDPLSLVTVKKEYKRGVLIQ